ncbi:hypothetical protein OSG_eHP8_00220 [environmental Halophage eHP-8]|nr:hypothetical protein OSG_eHP8_00220 [environmental Halophage eHP-8]AFH21969.1 hypothetical protein OSG_eHP13_00225 [environmental Halophage eHP-13]
MFRGSGRIQPSDILIALGLTAIGSSGTLFFALVGVRLSKRVHPMLAYSLIFVCGMLFVTVGITHRIKAQDA